MFNKFCSSAALAFGLSLFAQVQPALANWETVSAVMVCANDWCEGSNDANVACMNHNLNASIVEHDALEVWVYLSTTRREARKILMPYKVSAPSVSVMPGRYGVVCVTVESLRH